MYYQFSSSGLDLKTAAKQPQNSRLTLWDWNATMAVK
jgi:hypothetical protein